MQQTRIEEDQPVGTDEIETASSSLAAEEEDEGRVFRIIELIDELLTLLYGYVTIESQIAPAAMHVSSEASRRGDKGTDRRIWKSFSNMSRVVV